MHPRTTTTITTSRLILRQPRLSDAPALFVFLGDSERHAPHPR